MINLRGVKFWLAVLILGVISSCGGHVPMDQSQVPPPAPPTPERYGHPDTVLLKEALQGKPLTPPEVAALSDRLLAEGSSTFQDQETMARVELLLLKYMKVEDRIHRPRIMRNLGIVHYHQKQFKRARQELQASNELNPKDARTHFYLAKLSARQGQILQNQGQKKKAQGQFKLAAMELGLARKLEPSNPLYRQEIKQINQQESGK